MALTRIGPSLSRKPSNQKTEGEGRKVRSVLERPARASGRAHDEDGAMGVTDHGIGDVAHEGAFHPPEAAAAYNYQARVDILGEVDDRLIPLFVQLQVGDGDVTS